jgi:uncharacterized protein (TIGR02569 family)
MAAFGVGGPATRLPGGQGRSWHVGPAVLKPLDMHPAAIAWQSAALTAIDGLATFRVAPPLRSRDGEWVVSGWTAWRYEPGDHIPDRWREVIEIGRQFHAALSDQPRPGWLDTRSDVWAVADRVAWGEQPDPPSDRGENVAALVSALRPVHARPQLIHGDLTGNVLFDDDQPPLVIDLSPYWRPPPFASAVVAVDAMAFHHADAGIIDYIADSDDRYQYLLRALLFRWVTDHLRHSGRAAPPDDPYLPVARLALDLAGQTT